MRQQLRCPPGWRLTRATLEDDGIVRLHMAGCAACAAEYRSLNAVIADAGVLATAEELGHQARQTISARLLSPSAGVSSTRRTSTSLKKLGPSLRRAIAFGVPALAAFALAWALSRAAPPPQGSASRATAATPATQTTPATHRPDQTSSTANPQSRATIRAVDSAQFTRLTPPPDERVHLQEGVITLDVMALTPGERFRVVTDDAEVEVRGTHFEVTALRGRLVRVRVSSGRVEVKPAGGGLAVLDRGDEWVGGGTAVGEEVGAAPLRPTNRSRAAAAPATAPDRRSGHAPGGRRSGVDKDPRGGAAAEGPNVVNSASFDRAWALLRQGRSAAAATAFAEVARSARGNPIEEDASYWQAVSVARAGEASEARNLLMEFLRRFPASSRAGEAAVALGWLHLEAGQLDPASRAFQSALRDPSAVVRDRAQEGLRRAQPSP